MAASIYDMTGMGNTPMFVNYQPFKLDYSRAFAADERAFMMASKLQERFDAVQQQAQSLEIPMIDGLDIDRTEQYEEAISARDAYQRAVDVANPLVGQRSPEARAAMSRYMAAISPTRLGELKDKKVKGEQETENITRKPDLGGLPVIGPDGNFVLNKKGEWMDRLEMQSLRQSSPDYSINTPFGKNYDPSLNPNKTSEEVYDRWDKMFATRAQTAIQWANEGGRDQATGRNVPPSPEQSIASVFYTMKTKGASSVNLPQLESAMKTMQLDVTDAELYALLPAYKQTQQYEVLRRNGRFTNAAGKEDPKLVYDAMRNEKTMVLPVPGSVDKNFKVRHAHGSFLDRELVNQLGKWSDSSRSSEVQWDQMKPADDGGGNGNSSKVVPVTQYKSLQYSLNEAAGGLTVDESGAVVPKNTSMITQASVTMPLIVATSDSDGKPSGKYIPVKGFSEKMHPEVETDWRKTLGLPTSSFVAHDLSDKDELAKIPTIGQRGLHNVFRIGGSLVNSEAIRNGRIVDMDGTHIMVPGGMFRPEASNYGNLAQDANGASMLDGTTLFSSNRIEMPDGRVRYEPFLDDRKIQVTASGNAYNQGLVKVTVLLQEDDLSRMKLDVPRNIDLSSGTSTIDNLAGIFSAPIRLRNQAMENLRPMIPQSNTFDSQYVKGDALKYYMDRGIVRKADNGYLVDTYMMMTDTQGNSGPFHPQNWWNAVGVQQVRSASSVETTVPGM